MSIGNATTTFPSRKTEANPSDMSTDAQNGKGIRCPTCGHRHCPEDPTKVKRTIAMGRTEAIERIRQCQHCRRVFVTYERVAGVPIRDDVLNHSDVSLAPDQETLRFSPPATGAYPPLRGIG